MSVSSASRSAKEFLISRILQEADHEGVQLSDTERDMLYFSETGWSLPNILEINETFESEYDQEEYERKIAALIRNFKTRVRNHNRADLEHWEQAVHTLSSEDHYLLIMIHAADDNESMGLGRTGRLLQLGLIGIVGAIAALAITFVILFIARR